MLANYDDSYHVDVSHRLRDEPPTRLRKLAKYSSFDHVAPLAALERHQVDYVLIGWVAGALHGWPIMLTRYDCVEIVPAPGQANQSRLGRAFAELAAHALPVDDDHRGTHTIHPWELGSGGQVLITPTPAGTRGYRDLQRDVGRLPVDADTTVQVASLVDMIRISEASPRSMDRRVRIALLDTREEITNGPAPPSGVSPASLEELNAVLERPAA